MEKKFAELPKKEDAASVSHQTAKEIKDLFDKAEEAIKEAELIERKLPIPPINELRYAFYHYLRAQGNNPEEERSQLDRCKRHCQRALYDAYEIPLLYFIERFDYFKSTYDINVMNLAVADFPNKSRIVREALKKLNEIREARRISEREKNEGEENPNDRRHEFFEWCKQEKKNLQKIIEEFDDVEPQISEECAKRDHRYKKSELKATIGIVIGIIGTIAGIVGIAIAFIK